MEEVKQNLEEKINLNHDFDFLLILDFEATCSNDEKLNVQEIIEFPIVILDLKKNVILPEYFHTYVKPTYHPILTKFCTELTHITQEQVDNGVILESAIQQADEFLNKMGIIDKKFAFVCCGDFDLGQCLRLEAKFKKINYPQYFKQYINIKKQFPKEWYTESIIKWNKPPGMVAMLKAINLELQGTHHSGLDDSKNIARIAQFMVEHNIVWTKEMLSQVQRDKVKEKKTKKEKKLLKQNKQRDDLVETNNK
ncbi:exonuclease (macronuclear) [Tetrahymena thermophila SB210]|uniref:Exonuclease n=1 Tax=Tetrahymena thermophila (strain SB210) TaxID=312017 RepID=I7MMU1_TETTS|nr:exonuclease [Tetrahymena thermophila SB210]EAS06743.1 exonuclease [Tetrahymena thermophila SB210]|eukprot:XP_001026985.1 exonuclease [Tetrahymena thermophila SB210]